MPVLLSCWLSEAMAARSAVRCLCQGSARAFCMAGFLGSSFSRAAKHGLRVVFASWAIWASAWARCVGFIERLLDAEFLLHGGHGGLFGFGELLAVFELLHVLGELLQGLRGLLLGVGGLLQILGLGLALGGLGGLFEVLGDLRRVFLHLGQGDVGGAGHLHLGFLRQIGRVGLLTEGGLQSGHFLGVLGIFGLQGLRPSRRRRRRVFRLWLRWRRFGSAPGFSSNRRRQLLHHVADLGVRMARSARAAVDCGSMRAASSLAFTWAWAVACCAGSGYSKVGSAAGSQLVWRGSGAARRRSWRCFWLLR
jgi:hypothetical protein